MRPGGGGVAHAGARRRSRDGAHGLSVAIPEGLRGIRPAAQRPRRQHGVTCINAPGLIDAGYRGEVMSRSSTSIRRTSTK